MLVLRQRRDDEINIGDKIRIKVLRTQQGCVTLGIDAPGLEIKRLPKLVGDTHEDQSK